MVSFVRRPLEAGPGSSSLCCHLDVVRNEKSPPKTSADLQAYQLRSSGPKTRTGGGPGPVPRPDSAQRENPTFPLNKGKQGPWALAVMSGFTASLAAVPGHRWGRHFAAAVGLSGPGAGRRGSPWPPVSARIGHSDRAQVPGTVAPAHRLTGSPAHRRSQGRTGQEITKAPSRRRELLSTMH